MRLGLLTKILLSGVDEILLCAAGSIAPDVPAQARPLLFGQGWEKLRPHPRSYEKWLETAPPGYRKSLLFGL